MRVVRAPRDYRSLGIMIDRAHKPYVVWEMSLTVSLWFWDIEWTWTR